MQLTDDDIREFADIWEKEFHERLSPEVARHQASLLIDLYSELYLTHRDGDAHDQSP